MNKYERNTIHEILIKLKQAPMNFKQFSIMMTIKLALEGLKTTQFADE